MAIMLLVRDENFATTKRSRKFSLTFPAYGKQSPFATF